MKAKADMAQILEAMDNYLEGYEEALLHVHTLFPCLDLQPCKPYMRVEGNHLVDLTEEGHATGTLRGIPRIEVGQAEEGVADDVEPRVESG